jgi:hypothetical protein
MLGRQDISYQGPLIITKGGTYSGNWESQDPDVPAVKINTTEPVVITDSHMRGKGNLIQSGVPDIDLTVKKSRGESTNPNVRGKAAGRFVFVVIGKRVVFENNEMENIGGGVWLIDSSDHTDATSRFKEVKVRYNRARNIDCRKSDGNGGYLAERELCSFASLNQQNKADVEIAWNEVINEPYQSTSEDLISSYQSSGTSDRPILIHDNFIHGSYPLDPAADQNTATCIQLGDGSRPEAERAAGWVKAYNNVVTNCHSGIAISGGHDNEVFGNRVVSSGQSPDGRSYKAGNVGITIWDYYGWDGRTRSATFYRNNVRDNQVAVANHGGRSDYSFLDCDPNRGDAWGCVETFPGCDTASNPGGACTGNVTMNPGSLPTRDDEAAEYRLWQQRARDAGVVVGLGQAPSADQATVYEHGNYEGRSQSFGVGTTYDIGALNVVGNDAISSFRVPKGLRVVACEHMGGHGRCRIFEADTPWVGDQFNDLVSWLKVEAVQ